MLSVTRPSQWVNSAAYVICAVIASIELLAPLALGNAVWVYLTVRCTEYRLTTQRLIVSSGVLNRRVEECQLFRMQDATVIRSMLQRLVGLGRVMIYSADPSERIWSKRTASCVRPTTNTGVRRRCDAGRLHRCTPSDPKMPACGVPTSRIWI